MKEKQTEVEILKQEAERNKEEIGNLIRQLQEEKTQFLTNTDLLKTRITELEEMVKIELVYSTMNIQINRIK